MSGVSFPRRLGWAARLAIEAPRAGRLPFSRRRIERSARRALRGSIQHAYEFVPYYRELFDARGLRPADLATAADLAALPILEREQLQSEPQRFVSTRTPRESLVELKTGGSSGEPLTVYVDPAALIQGAAQRERRRRMFQREVGRRLRLRSLTFGTEQSTGRTTAGAFARHSLIPRGVRLVSTQHSMLEPLEDNVRLIERLRPDVVGGYGSYLELLMDYIEDRGGASHLPSLLAWGGDGMSERGRRTIPERFGVPVYGLYGAVEAFHIGFECGAHRGFHVNTDIHPLRLVDDDGNEVPDGASGQVVVSNLVSRGTIVLNYRLGDVARWIPGPCPCGRVLPTLSFVEGRVDDWLELPDGELLHPQGLRELFTPEDEHVRRYQVEQRSPSDYLVRLVSAAGLQAGREQLVSRLAARFRAAVGEGVRVEFEFVPEIERTARGKTRIVISPSSRRRAVLGSEPEIRPARGDELEAILAVMEPANMHDRDSPEMPALDLDRFFIAELEGKIVGAAGWELIDADLAKTTLLAVLPEARGRRIGEALQRARMEAMTRAGASRVRTNADRPPTIAWYKREFGYVEVGRLAKVASFGDPEVDAWTTLEAPLPPPR